MGLEKYGLSLFEGVTHYEQLACLENNGIKRYVTGLNEFAPDVRNSPNVELREAKVREIRTAVAELEKILAANMIDIEDKDFWNKVQLLRPDNDEFWGKIDMKCGNDPIFTQLMLEDSVSLLRAMKMHAHVINRLSSF